MAKNSDSDKLRRLLEEFLGFNRSSSSPSETGRTGPIESPPSAVRASEVGSDAVSLDLLLEAGQSFNFGDKPIVQDRFHTLLKNRFHTEYENHPPLFPWETEAREYPVEEPAHARAGHWLTHTGRLTVSSKLPEPVLAQLLERCQTMMHSSLQRGIKLVRIVGGLFPDHSEVLDPIANIVLTEAYRGPDLAEATLQEIDNLAGGYHEATPEQQIALAMLAAKEIVGALTLTVSAADPSVTREWDTSEGTVSVEATYLNGMLLINVMLPTGGSIQLIDSDSSNEATRIDSGMVSLAKGMPELDRAYPLELTLDQGGQRPLRFSVSVTEA